MSVIHLNREGNQNHANFHLEITLHSNLLIICYVYQSFCSFDDLGGKDDFSTEMLEWRLGCAGVIKYNGNLTEPPTAGGSKTKKSLLGPQKKKTIRGGMNDDSDSDLE